MTTDMDQPSSDESDYLWKSRSDLMHRLEVSVRYHRKRESYFDMLDRWTKAIAIVGGSAALADIGGRETVRWAAAIIATTSTAALVFGFSEKARLHNDLAAQFGVLESSIARRGERGFLENDLNTWNSELRMIETREPPILSTLARICEEENYRARGHSTTDKVPAYRRWFAQLF